MPLARTRLTSSGCPWVATLDAPSRSHNLSVSAALYRSGSEFGLVRGWLLIWDPAAPGAGPVELGHHDKVWAVAALLDGRVVSGGGDRRAVVWDVTTRKEIAQI